MEIKDKLKDIFSFSELIVGDVFELWATTEKLQKQGPSQTYTKINEISGEVVNGEWTGKANCTYETFIGKEKVLKYSWFPGPIWCKKIASTQNKDN